jgi:hypothetical protein
MMIVDNTDGNRQRLLAMTTGKKPVPRHVRTRRPGPAKGIGGLFPVPYLKIIEQEAASLGQSRSGFLTLLVKRQLGEVVLERHANALTYELDRKEMAKTQHYVFYVPRDLAGRINDEMLRMGNLAANAYVIGLVNNWLGCPGGLRFEGESQPR